MKVRTSYDFNGILLLLKVYMTRQSLWSFSSMVLAQILEPHPLGELSPRLPKMTGFHSWFIMFMDCGCICFYLFVFVCHYILHICCVYICVCARVCVCICFMFPLTRRHSYHVVPFKFQTYVFFPTTFDLQHMSRCHVQARPKTNCPNLFTCELWLCMEAWVKLLAESIFEWFWHVMTSSD